MGKRSAAHIRAQKNGKIRDNYTCQVCGSKEKVEGHHIIDHQFCGAAKKDNIISLCHECHKKAHNGKLDLFKFWISTANANEIIFPQKIFEKM